MTLDLVTFNFTLSIAHSLCQMTVGVPWLFQYFWKSLNLPYLSLSKVYLSWNELFLSEIVKKWSKIWWIIWYVLSNLHKYCVVSYVINISQVSFLWWLKTQLEVPTNAFSFNIVNTKSPGHINITLFEHFFLAFTVLNVLTEGHF